MELHAVLRELVDAHGRDVLGDPTVFRGVLDDYLDEAAATTGEINLLVDAVRFGALPSLVTMIDSGAEPERAVVEAGGRLTRERGGEDTRAGSWAVAVLGYALGKVPEPVLARYPSPSRSSTQPPGGAPSAHPGTGTYQRAATQWPAPTSGGAPTAVPNPPPTHSPATGLPPTGWPQSGPNQPVVSPAHTPTGTGQGSWPPPGGSSGPTSGGTSKRPVALIAAVAVVLVLVVGGLVGFLVTRGGDDDPKNDAGGDTSETPEVDTSVEAVTERYSALGGDVAAEASECTPGEVRGDDVMEVVDCTMAAGTLQLVTYSTATALETSRNRVIDQREGTIQEVTGDSAFYSFDPANSQSSDPAQVYWDSYQGLQSALLTGNGGTEADAITAAFENTRPTVSAPTKPTNQDLIEFLDSLDTKIVPTCDRVPSYAIDMLQEHQCSFKGYSVFAGRFDNIQRLKQARQEATSSQATSDVYPADDNIYDDVNGNNVQDDSEPTIGAVRGYTLESDTGSSAVLYIDHGTCRCYVELWHVKEAGEEPIDPEVMADDIF